MARTLYIFNFFDETVCILLVVCILFDYVLHRVLVDTVLNFPPSLEEVTVSVSDERVWFRNHVEEDTGE